MSPFDYVYIPADSTKDVEHRHFAGRSDEELKRELVAFFRTTGNLTDGQRAAFKANLLEQVKQKQAEQAARAGGDAAAAAAAPVDPGLLTEAAAAAHDGQYEIVPVTMPCLQNGFVATSLYIDDKGRYKELPLNDRASKVAQRDIRGDAFLLSNHDDPALDTWERVDTPMALYQHMHDHPGVAFDTGNSGHMAAANAARMSATRLVSEDDAAAAAVAKAEGNAKFASAAVDDAVAAYTKAIELTAARVDKLKDPVATIEVRRTAFLNRAQCRIQQRQWAAARDDAEAALAMKNDAPKAWYRLAVAQAALSEFDKARAAARECAGCGGADAEVAALLADIGQRESAAKAAEKERFKGMFA